MIRTFGRLLGVAALSLALAGCFRPVYAPTLGAAGPVLAAIEVAEIEGHLGHQIKSELDFLLSNGNPPENPVHRLTIRPTKSIAGVVVDAASARPITSQYQLTATYQLVEIKTGKSVASGSAQSLSSYDRTTQRFSNVRALRDAEIRAAKLLAEQIRARLVPHLTGMAP